MRMVLDKNPDGHVGARDAEQMALKLRKVIGASESSPLASLRLSYLKTSNY
jgi:hypothetical protein